PVQKGLNEYLAKIPHRPTGVQSLADVIEFNRTHKESQYMGQENQIKLVLLIISWTFTHGFIRLTESEATNENAQYKETVKWLQLKSREEGIDACLEENSLDTTTPFRQDSNAPYLSAPGLPFGIVFMGTAWSERTLIGCAYALEQQLKVRSKRKAYAAAIPRSQISATPGPERGKHAGSWMMSQYAMASTTDHDIPDLYDAEISQLKEGLQAGRFTSAQLVKAYIARINEVNENGPRLRVVLEINAAAIEQAEQLDEQRRLAQIKGEELPLLHGIPILLKDNIATKSPTGFDEKLNTTAGSFALVGCFPPEDATVAKKLRDAGAIILGKLNMSEWAHWRGKLPSGWSSRGGQCTNSFFPGADPSGSSSGSGVAAAIGLAAGTLGSETDGTSVPTFLTPDSSTITVIPISKSQDSVGPMCRTVSDTAILLQAISGRDNSDETTLQQPPVPDYLSALRPDFLKGVRIGVLRGYYAERAAWKEEDSEEAITARLQAFERGLEYMKELGAELVDSVEIETVDELVKNEDRELTIFYTEFK
ncbi:2362_t:CDS:2, partial [Acaulospora colombiana]